jgi:GAF domain-containing protein
MKSAPMDPNEAFAELGRIRLGSTSIDGILQRVAELASMSVPGAEEVSVTLVRDHQASTAAHTGPLARELDEWQYGSQEGPCLQAAREQTLVSVDLASDKRWPSWAERALSAGVRCSLSVGLPLQDKVTGALNLYATSAQAFDEDAVLISKTFGGYAAVALANAHLYGATADLAEHMRKAMEHRAVIEQAKGIIMGERRCSPDEAFAILSKISQDSNRKLRDVAAALVSRAETPVD